MSPSRAGADSEARPGEGSSGQLERGRRAYAARRWLDAYTELQRADREASLGAEDLELLATAA
jgi:hypothetical protein